MPLFLHYLSSSSNFLTIYRKNVHFFRALPGALKSNICHATSCKQQIQRRQHKQRQQRRRDQPADDHHRQWLDRKSTRLNSSHLVISYAVFCLKKKNKSSKSMLVSIKPCTR